MADIFKSFGILIPLGSSNEQQKTPIPTISYKAKPDLIMRHVWSEGYRATGEHGTATYHGCCLAESHLEACVKLCSPLDTNEDGSVRLDNEGHPMIWACRLFDNEVDARKVFG